MPIRLASAAVLSVFLPVCHSNGAFEPWASNTHPADIPRRHVQEVTTSPCTYTITMGGTMDGKMCRTLPGVWEPYEQTWESSRSIRMENSDYVEAPRPFIYSAPVTNAPVGQPYRYPVKAIRSLGDLTRRDAARPKPGARFWKIEPLKFSLTQKPGWMSIDPDTGLITGTPDGTGGTVTVSVTLTKEYRLVHDKDNIVWGNEYEQSRTYETVGPITQQFVINAPGKE